MGFKKGIVHLIPVILITLVIASVYVLLATFVFKNFKFPGKTSDTSQEARVELRTEYKNPFDKKSQYINPFDQYKSPFYSLK